eukprot:SAG11_NODE_2367_length_3454_cov_16.447094_1_plen_762_part_00
MARKGMISMQERGAEMVPLNSSSPVAPTGDGTKSAKEELEGPGQWEAGSAKRAIFEFLEGGLWAVVITFFTFWALFMPDIIQVLLPKELDKVMAAITLAGFVMFTAEIVLNFVVRRDYGGKGGANKLTWFLLIDVLGTVSLVPDFVILFDVYVEVAKSAGLARAGRAARIGARLSKLVRMFRMKSQEEFAPDGSKLEMKASNVGTEIADKISTRVVLLVMILISLLPVLTYSPAATQEQLAAEFFNSLLQENRTSTELTADLKKFTDWYNTCDFDRCARTEELVYMQYTDMESSLTAAIDVRLDPATNSEKAFYEQYRREVEYQDQDVWICQNGGSTVDEEPCSDSIVVKYKMTFMIKAKLVEQSIMSLFFMLFAVLIIGVGAGGFLADVQKYVITPIERMTSILRNLEHQMVYLTADTDTIEKEGGSEMEVLCNSIEKMIGLLHVGFGEAGTQIIEKNLQESTEEIDPLMPGEMVDNIYIGFIMLENFNAVTDVMEEDIMLYANYIGDVIHRCIRERDGNPNKNMGGAILCVWKGENGASRAFESFQKAIETVDADPEVRALCDKHKEGLEQYENGRLLHHHGPAGAPRRYVVELAAGLHCGWAIEGPVGSPHKIDATYLSPNVNMAARMETATAQFGVHLICSQTFYEELAHETKRRCRHLDTCLVKGSVEPLPFWSPTLGVDDSSSPDHLNAYTKRYCEATSLYIGGYWAKAKALLEQCSKEYPNDGAPKTILKYMQDKGGTPPKEFLAAKARKLESK